MQQDIRFETLEILYIASLQGKSTTDDSLIDFANYIFVDTQFLCDY